MTDTQALQNQVAQRVYYGEFLQVVSELKEQISALEQRISRMEAGGE